MTSSCNRVFYLYRDPLLDPVSEAAFPEVDRVYQDLGDRQQWQKLLQDCRTEPIGHLVIRRLEELGDSLAAVANSLAELEALNIELIVLETQLEPQQNKLDPTVPRSELIKLLQTTQNYHRSQRLRQGHARNRLKALPPPGKAPYGYRRGKDRYILDRSTAPIVKDFFDHFLLYGSLRGSVRFLQKKYSKKISVSTGKRWLTSPIYRGDLLYQGREVIPDTHLPILPRNEAAQVDRLLRRNQRMPPRTASAPRSLSGLVVCGSCESVMKISQVNSKAKSYLYLRPVACPTQPACRALPYQRVLEQIIQQICQDLPTAVNAAPIPDIDAMKQTIDTAIAAKQVILEQLPSLIESGILDAETAELRAYKVRTEIAAMRTRLDQLPPVNLKSIAQVVSLPQFWLDLSEAERRFYFREFIQQIKIQQQAGVWKIQLVFIF